MTLCRQPNHAAAHDMARAAHERRAEKTKPSEVVMAAKRPDFRW
jgi:hypothetical protein